MLVLCNICFFPPKGDFIRETGVFNAINNTAIYDFIPSRHIACCLCCDLPAPWPLPAAPRRFPSALQNIGYKQFVWTRVITSTEAIWSRRYSHIEFLSGEASPDCLASNTKILLPEVCERSRCVAPGTLSRRSVMLQRDERGYKKLVVSTCELREVSC